MGYHPLRQRVRELAVRLGPAELREEIAARTRARSTGWDYWSGFADDGPSLPGCSGKVR